jgi:putative ABC transport system permease protein
MFLKDLIKAKDVKTMYFELAKRNLRRNLLRSILALMGIIIGVAAISSLGILGGGLKQGIMENLGGISNYIIVFPNYQNGYTSFDKKDVEKLRVLNCRVIPIYATSDFVYIKGKNRKTYANIFGIDKNDINYLNLKVKVSDTSVAVDTFFSNINEVSIGNQLEIKNISLRISEIYNSTFLFPDNSIILTAKTYRRFYGADNYSRILLHVKNIKDIDKIKNETEKILNRKEKKCIIISLNSILEAINGVITKVSYFLMGIGAISLLVAGIGIGNVMLMSVVERTKEIGVMRSIGASKRDIIMMFLYEALILGVIGSLIGAFLSLFFGYLIVHYLLKSSLSYYAIFYMIIGIMFGILTALISALYPAYKASKLDPIKALRNE